MKHRLKIKPKTLRKVHSYLSLIFCCLFCFYLITGFFLNHPYWFESKATVVVKEIDFAKQIGDLSLVDVLSSYNITLSSDQSQQLENSSEFEMKGPGWETVINLENNTLEVETIDYGFLAIINDLHKNRHVHVLWTIASDVFIFFTLIMCVTGIWISLKNIKNKGTNMKLLLAGGLGLLLFILVIPTASSAEVTTIKMEASIEIPRFETKTENPYIALFSKNSASEYRTYRVLKERYKWVKDLKVFWRKIARSDRSLVDAHSGATRKAGAFKVQFELLMNVGERIEDVVFYLEAAREKGGREILSIESLDSNDQVCVAGEKEILKFCLQRLK